MAAFAEAVVWKSAREKAEKGLHDEEFLKGEKVSDQRQKEEAYGTHSSRDR